MLYKEILESQFKRVSEAIGELFVTARKNQTHENDLLAILVNGFYDESIKEASGNHSPFLIGPHFQHYAELTQYEFYHLYRITNIKNIKQKEYLDFIKATEKESMYSLGTQLELMIYLKIWESNRFLERLYKLTQLALGNNYDWHFQIEKDDSRQDLIRNEIRNPLKEICPKFFQLIKDIYLSQIRNAVAHSQFYIVGTGISFLNYDPQRHAPINHMKIEEWEYRFHLLALMYNEYIRNISIHNYLYIRKSRNTSNGLTLRMTELNQTTKSNEIIYAKNPQRWIWIENYTKH